MQINNKDAAASALCAALKSEMTKDKLEKNVVLLVNDTCQINSFVNLALAIKTLGKDKVFPVFPSFMEDETWVKKICDHFGIAYKKVDVAPAVHSLSDQIKMNAENDIINLAYREKMAAAFYYSNTIPGSVIPCNIGQIEFKTGFYTIYGDYVGAIQTVRNFPKSDIIALAKGFGIPQTFIDYSLSDTGGEALYLKWFGIHSWEIEKLLPDLPRSPLKDWFASGLKKGRSPAILSIPYGI